MEQHQQFLELRISSQSSANELLEMISSIQRQATEFCKIPAVVRGDTSQLFAIIANGWQRGLSHSASIAIINHYKEREEREVASAYKPTSSTTNGH